mmetsp:Transcript_138524/g.386412  ORF Transcript_138524/g.386412 Transcript_138524/m.386412 type:complete len:235 (+) Transcript_138524:113-817(+)
MVQLDDVAQARVLAFNLEPRARVCCKAWERYVYDSLQLGPRIRFHKAVREAGRLCFHHCGVRSMGGDFEECVAYQFEFAAPGTFSAQWNRSFGQWSAANERQVGCWEVRGDALRCETSAGPGAADGCVHYAPAGRVFELPVASVLEGTSSADDTTPAWEYQVRGAPVPSVRVKAERGAEDTSGTAGAQAALPATGARFVEVDGELHEVSADIQKHYPEAEWQRLMSCRVRFGLS